MIKYILFFLILINELSFAEDNSAIVLMYHRFNEPMHQSTNISPNLFRQHLELIKKYNFNVLDLKSFVDILRNKKRIPKKTIIITVDDAFKSFYNYGYPILKEFNFPFSVFVSTASISNEKNSDFMSWEMLRDIKMNKGMIFNHTVDHLSLVDLCEEIIIEQVKKASNQLRLKLGDINPKIFSYPYGESSERVEKILEKQGFIAAFSQHSAPLDHTDSLFRLPRFSLNNEYGTTERLQMIFKTKKLPIKNLTFTDSITKQENVSISFQSSFNLEKMNCYVNQGVRLEKKVNEMKVRIRLENLKMNHRHRLNCK